MKDEKCRSCGSPVAWEKTEKGKWCPFNPDGTSHFTTCPQASDWSRNGRANEIKVSDPPKFLTRVGNEQVLCRPARGGVLITSWKLIAGARFVQLEMHDADRVLVLTEEEHRRLLALLARILHDELDVTRLAPLEQVPEETGVTRDV